MLVKLFLSDAEQDRKVFKEEFDQILSEVPNRVGNEENFWIYFFLGSILTLPDTELMKNLGIKKIELKISDDQKNIKLRITTEGKVICRSMNTGSKNPIVKCEDSNLSNESGFTEITKIIKRNSGVKLGEKVTQESLETLFKNLAEIYKEHSENLELEKKTEALHQAFIYGFLKMNTEINCFIEFGAGLGIADLVLKVDDTAIIVECKADLKTAEDAINQIKRKGYFCLEILGECKLVFLVGLNFNKQEDKGLKVEEHEIFEPQGLINILMSDGIEELEEAIQKELEFLCYTKNIGICNPDNPSNHNEADPQNKYVGSFTALVLGQMLQYCRQNEECEFTTHRREENKIQNTELAIISSDNKLKLSITEFIDKGGNVSPEHETTDDDISSPERDNDSVFNDDRYNVKIELAKNNKKFTYKIIFPGENSNGENSNKVIVQKEKNRSSSSQTRSSSVRQLKSTKDPDCSYFSSPEYPQSSSQESGASPRSSYTQNVDIEKLIQEIESSKKSYLQEILTKHKDFINSEANLQLFLKGLFMNAETDDGRIVAEIEVSAGQAGKIDLLLKLSNGKGITFELKYCDEVQEISDNQIEAWEQLEHYINKGTLKYILDCEQHNLFAVVVVSCAKAPECTVEVESLQISENSFNDSGIGSSLENLSEISINSGTPSTSINNTPLPSLSVKRKEMSPLKNIVSTPFR